MKQQIFLQVQDTLTRVLGADVRHLLTIDATMEDVPSWDSMTFVLVMMALEEDFGVSISPDDAADIASISGIIKLIERQQ